MEPPACTPSTKHCRRENRHAEAASSCAGSFGVQGGETLSMPQLRHLMSISNDTRSRNKRRIVPGGSAAGRTGRHTKAEPVEVAAAALTNTVCFRMGMHCVHGRRAQCRPCSIFSPFPAQSAHLSDESTLLLGGIPHCRTYNCLQTCVMDTAFTSLISELAVAVFIQMDDMEAS